METNFIELIKGGNLSEIKEKISFEYKTWQGFLWTYYSIQKEDKVYLIDLIDNLV